MKKYLSKALLVLPFVFTGCMVGCKVVTAKNSINAWNGYRNDCPSGPLTHYDFPVEIGRNHRVVHRGEFLPQGYVGGTVLRGYVVLKKKDTVSGLIRYNGTNLVQVLPDGERMADYNIKNFSYYDIQYFRVYVDSSEPRNCYTDYVFLRPDFKVRVNLTLDDKLWRQLGKKGNVGIYDDFTYLSNYSTHPVVKIYDAGRARIYNMFLLTGNGVSLIYRSPFRGITGSLLKFINRRYHTQFHRHDFKTVRSMIDYILDKEN
jgi:hypothetical protein